MQTTKYPYYDIRSEDGTRVEVKHWDKILYQPTDSTSLYYLLKEIYINWKDALLQLKTGQVSYSIRFRPKPFNILVPDSCYKYWQQYGSLREQISKRIELLWLLDQYRVINFKNKNEVIDLQEGYTRSDYATIHPHYSRVQNLLLQLENLKNQESIGMKLHFDQEDGILTFRTTSAKFKQGTKAYLFLWLILSENNPNGWTEDDIRTMCNKRIPNPNHYFKQHKDIYATYRTIKQKLNCSSNEYFPISWQKNRWIYLHK